MSDHEREPTKRNQPAATPQPTPTHDAPTGASPQPKPSGDVLTKWLINYNSVLGRRKDPTRTANDQLVVDELRIQPNNGDTQILDGGNMARSGRVELGDVWVPPGPGTVAGLVRYAQRSAFTVKLSLAPAPSAKERKVLHQLAAKAKARAIEEAATIGDYDAIAATVQQELAEHFPEKDLRVEIIPAPKSNDGIAPQDAEYRADTASTFEVRIDPEAITEQTRTASHGESRDVSHGRSSSKDQKITTDQTLSNKTTDTAAMEQTIMRNFTTAVSDGFTRLEQSVMKASSTGQTHHETDVKWHFGIGQKSNPSTAGDAKPGAPKGSDDEGSLLGKLWDVAVDGVEWLWEQGKNRIPIVKAGVDAIAGIWDAVSGRLSVDVNRATKDSNGTTVSQGFDYTHSNTIHSLTQITNAVTRQVTATATKEVEKIIAARLGTEVSAGTKEDESSKRSVNQSSVETSTIYEARRPKITIKKLQ